MRAKDEEYPVRNYSLDILKFVASIMIVFHHYQQMTDVPFPSGINYWNGKFNFGYIVELFFILSGYFMVRYIDRIKNATISLKQFYLHRLLRLLPLVLISAIVYEIQLYIYTSLTNESYYGINISLFGIVIDALCIQSGGAFPNPCVNNPTWYLSVLMICYVVFFLISRTARLLKTNENYFYIGMILLGFTIMNYSWNYPYLNNETARGYCCFFIGLLLGRIVEKNGITKVMVVTAVSTICVLAFFYQYAYQYIANNIYSLLVLFIYPSIIIIFNTKVFRILFHRPIFGLLGKISFDIYLWHNPLIQTLFIVVIVLNLKIDYANRIYMYCFLAVVIAVSILSHLLIEKPVNKWLMKKCKIEK